MDEIDFYRVGLAAALYVELGQPDAARMLITEKLSGMVAEGYRLPFHENYHAKAQELLHRLAISDDNTEVKDRCLELMLFDRDVPKKELEAFQARYAKRSVCYLGIAREKPRVAAVREFLDDIVRGVEYAARGTARIATSAVSVPYLLFRLGEKTADAVATYYRMTNDERAGFHKRIAGAAKNISIKTGKVAYHTIDAIVSGAILGGLFTPTGVRRFFANIFEYESQGERGERVDYPELTKSVAKLVSGTVGLSFSFVYMIDAMNNPHHHFAQIVLDVLQITLTASALYEAGRFTVKTIRANTERLSSYQALPKAKQLLSGEVELGSESVQPVQLRVDVDDHSNEGINEVPIYLDINGQEELVHGRPENIHPQKLVR